MTAVIALLRMNTLRKANRSLKNMLNDIEDTCILTAKGSNEILTKALGDRVIKEWYALDHVAYICFATVYKNFDSL